VDWLNYHHLHYFWMVAREGSMTRAAKLLHLTPATLSIQIRELEKSLKVKLLRKEGRSVVLTDVGVMVMDYANNIFSTGKELMEVIQGAAPGSLMRLRVGVKDVMPKLVAYKFLEPALAEPWNIKLLCFEGGLEDLVADLSIHRLDLVLSDTPLNPTMRVRAYSHLLGESKVEWMGCPELVHGLKPGYPKSLHRAPCLMPMQNSALRGALDRWFENRGIRPDVRGEFDDSAMLKIAAQAGAGIMAVPTMIADKVRVMYQVESLAAIEGVSERFYAISVDRKLKNPASMVICQTPLSHDG